ncbi:hypothetical protein KFK09_023251 [Dendrobium nobile]|uniref:Uncharacterized protein n=1 Tax=Dendrobium nobile TaxID=94219 RepID=A0A8T3AS53_DENNO|nr:hypothetical protein KFK09_023251 [Dendrobium nobile]
MKAAVDGKLPLVVVNPRFPKSSDSADLRDLAEEAREREKVTFTASELPVVASDQNVVTSDPKERERLRGAKSNSDEGAGEEQQRRRNKGEKQTAGMGYRKRII